MGLSNIPGAKIWDVPDQDVSSFVLLGWMEFHRLSRIHGKTQVTDGPGKMNIITHCFPSPDTNQHPAKSNGDCYNPGMGIGQRGDYKWHNVLQRA